MSSTVAVRTARAVELRVRDPLTATALRALLPEAVTQSRTGVPTLVITDDLILANAESILIVGSSAVSAARAMQLISAGRLGGVCPTDKLDDIKPIIRAVQKGLTGMPREFASRAASAPVLDEALLQTMSYVQRGFSNQAISRMMHVSNSTVKRRVNQLISALGAHDRGELVVMSLN